MKEKLSELGLSTTGKKEELVARLVEYYAGKEKDSSLDDDLLEPPPEEMPEWVSKLATPAPKATSPKHPSGPPKSPVLKPTAAPVASSATKSPVAAKPLAAAATSAPAVTASPVKITQEMSEEEKRRLRAARFGLPVKPVTEAAKPTVSTASKIPGNSNCKI